MADAAKIPVSVIVVTKNEARNIERCLLQLSDFAELIVVDSSSTDGTAKLARAAGAEVISYTWDGHYPKKRQWALDTLALKSEWVFFVDADEVVTQHLIQEIRILLAFGAPAQAGYFVPGRYVWQGKILSHGLKNNKLALFDRRQIAFPVIDDLDIPGMGEIEGHYQPVLKTSGTLGQLQHFLLHYAHEDEAGWERRHRKYAVWEVGMNFRKAWPRDPDPKRQRLKEIFRALPCRGMIAFLYSYVFKQGYLDGAAGFDFAYSRYRYYDMIKKLS